MGCGKSWLGRELHAVTGMPFIDMDKAIEEKQGQSIREIFEQKGELYFRELERDFIQQLDENQDLIIATGGGAACFFDNMQRMNAKGLTIYLNRSKDKALAQLLKGQYKRPMLDGLSPEQVSEFYDLKLAERAPFYELAKVKAGDKSTDEVLSLIHAFKNQP